MKSRPKARLASSLRVILSVVAGSSLLATALATPVQAAPASSGLVPSVALASLMDLYPGSVMVAERTIRIAPGVILTMPDSQPSDEPIATDHKPFARASAAAKSDNKKAAVVPAVKPAGPTGNKPAEPATLVAGGSRYGCPYEYLCIYDGPNMPLGGYMLGLYFCGFADLGTYNFPPGGHWNDRMSSYVNNQTDGTYSTFHNWNGTNAWLFLYDSTALDWWGTPSYDNTVDGIWVC